MLVGGDPALASTRGARRGDDLAQSPAAAARTGGHHLTEEALADPLHLPAAAAVAARDGLCAGAGAYAVARIVETDGVWLSPDEQTPEGIAANWAAITSTEGEKVPQAGFEQTIKFTAKAAEGLGIKLD